MNTWKLAQILSAFSSTTEVEINSAYDEYPNTLIESIYLENGKLIITNDPTPEKIVAPIVLIYTRNPEKPIS